MHVKVTYRARYAYDEAVSFSQHTVRLFPRQDQDIQVESFNFRTNEGADAQYRRDVFDNAIINLFYPQASSELVFEVGMRLMVRPKNPFHFLLAPEALQFPFNYAPSKRKLLAPFTAKPASRRGVPDLPFWTPPSADRPAPTVETLVSLNRAISEHIDYERRETGEPRDPQQTLAAGVGACRDLAVLFAAVVRSLGLACRLVSGYLCEFDLDPTERRAEAALHAWNEVYLPGAGWVGFDPTHGVLCDHNFISTAVGIDPSDVAPISGQYFADHQVASRLDVKVELAHLTTRSAR